jgi:hypothetical protein
MFYVEYLILCTYYTPGQLNRHSDYFMGWTALASMKEISHNRKVHTGSAAHLGSYRRGTVEVVGKVGLGVKNILRH